MSVHEAITAHTRKMHSHLEVFQALDAEREQAIEKAVQACKAGQTFSVEEINRATARINEHAKHGISPVRPFVTEQMLLDYVKRDSL